MYLKEKRWREHEKVKRRRLTVNEGRGKGKRRKLTVYEKRGKSNGK